MSDIAHVIVTGEATKLPPAYAELLDPQKALPLNISFFEKRITSGQIFGAIGYAIGFAGVGVLATLFGVYYLFSSANTVGSTGTDYLPLGFGVTCLFVSWMMLDSLRLRRNLMRQQQRGEPTRIGIFLTPDTLFEANEFGYCIVPRAQFRGLVGKDVRYMQEDKEKSFRLPENLVRGDIAGMSSAIGQWAKTEEIAVDGGTGKL